MSFFEDNQSAVAPRGLCDLLLRDVASLLLTSRFVSRSLDVLRPECEFSRELTETIDTVIAICEAGEELLHEPLAEAGAVLPLAAENATASLATGLFRRLPAGIPGALGAEMAVNLRLLAQHLELKSRLGAEEALLAGQERIGNALLDWSAAWRNCGLGLRFASARPRVSGELADIEEFIPARSA